MTQPRDFYQYLEAKRPEKSHPVQVLAAMGKALQDVFKKYTRSTRVKALRRLTSEKGKDELMRIAWQPSRSLNRLRSLWTD